MKLWKFVSILGGDVRRAVDISASNGDWIMIGQWLGTFTELVRSQAREKLDYELPREFVRENLRVSSLEFYLSEGNWIRSRPISSSDRKITALEAYDTYGGDALEEALEKGSMKV